MIYQKGDSCVTQDYFGFYKFREGAVPYTGKSSHKKSNVDDIFDIWENTKRACIAHKRKDPLKYDEDHAPFVRHKIKNIHSKKTNRSWKNRKFRHQWAAHIK